MKILPRTIAMFLLLVILNGCSSSSTTSPSGLATATMQIGSKTYTLEIAADEASREKGLMDRDTLERDHGMIFVFDHAAEQSFWMHHTRFGLDIIFADDQAKIVSVHTMRAYDESSTSSDGLAKYAIELSAGEAAAAGVKAGDVLSVPQAVTATVGKK